ncbi:TPA: hypothetical protein ACOENC_000440 [Stenotrophomonas maltophilia]|uniref:P-loop ATPase, Sll1717 family n=1 Tax=Stenotrophomonas maltophilia group TaxID=995085 RepID=UPI00146389C7|nr:hypothetical protein [Stenotrophomonas maltophilia]QJP18998.1 hypothetical protein HKK60_05425 [Stenotrophomonas maltophilia]
MSNAATADIRDVNFGRLDAESDPDLGDFFLDTGVTARIDSGEHNLILGRKGSGKTALFTEAKLRPGILRLDFHDYAWDAHKAIQELGGTADSRYMASWAFTFLVAACRTWTKSPYPEVRDAAKAMHLSIYGADAVGGTLDILVDRAKRIRQLELPSAGDFAGLGSIKLADPPGAQLAQTAHQWLPLLEELAKKCLPKHPLTIFIDRLDDGWDASDEIKLMLAGAIKAARNLNLAFRRIQTTPFVVLFLRTDIFELLRFGDKGKLSQDVEKIEWSDDTLVSMVNKRIASSCPVRADVAWDSVFSTERIRQRTTIQRYILKRTMRRPRDLVAFCLEIKKAAKSNGVSVATRAEVYKAEDAYSEHIYGELVDEMHKQLPATDLYFAALNKVGHVKFNQAAWSAAVKSIDPSCADPGVWLNHLYEYGVVGVPVVGGKAGGSKVEFVYDNRFGQENIAGEVYVHPALIKALKLKEGSAADPTPVEFDDEADDSGCSE